MGSVEDNIDKKEFERERLASYALKQNPQMKDFGDFKDAFLDAFSIRQGRNFPFLDDEHLKKIWETNTVQETIFQNNPEGQEKEEERAKDFELIRGDGKLFEAKMIYAPKRITKKEYTTTKGIHVKGYQSGYRKWTPAQTKFIASRKARKITNEQIIREYNAHFNKEQRSSESIKSKIYERK